MEVLADAFVGDRAREIAAQLQVEAQGYPDARDFVWHLCEQYGETDLAQPVIEYAGWVDIHSTMSFSNPPEVAGRAFAGGGLVGLRVMEICLGTNSIRRLKSSEVTIPIPPKPASSDSDTRYQYVNRCGEIFCEVGDQGFARASAYHEMLASLVEDISGEASCQSFAKRGFGLSMHFLDSLLRLDQVANQAAFRSEIESFGDWDNLWATMLDSPNSPN